ncbi:hypothetical protein C1645_841973 [Glomus cerebriforme]|uniref:3-hydroxyacyl-CoA dehydrogenase NAD binding domain-containing protein n=1 Tax=Glomus cerebriforme TaxID=658196 RepID=A0A397S2I6_9GLOM|nr:hypothetical protein C1645_841973 [Glomus cerebriforme]
MNYIKRNIIFGQVGRYVDLKNKNFSLLTKAHFHYSVPVLSNKDTSDHGVKQLGIIGIGQMGLGIALVSASVAKLPVKIFDLNSKQIEKGLSFMGS